MATLANYENNSVNPFMGTNESDSLVNRVANVTIYGYAGNDSIRNYNTGESVKIFADSGDNYIRNDGANVTISVGAGNDYINNYNYSVIDAGAGNNSVSAAANNTISTSSGTDSILIYEHNNVVYAGTGDDTVHLYMGSSNNSIVAGTGNDVISLDSGSQNNVIRYSDGDGADTFYGYTSANPIQIINYSSTLTSVKSGNDLIIKIGDGSINLKNSADIAPVIVNSNGDIVQLESEETDTAVNAVYVDLNFEGNQRFSGYFSVSDSSSIATFNAAADSQAGDNETIVGHWSLTSGYTAVDSFAQYINSPTIAGRNIVATSNDDTINIAGNNATIAGGAGNDLFSVGNSVTSVTFTDFGNGEDKLSFADSITAFSTVGSSGSEIVLSSDAVTVNFKNVSVTADNLNSILSYQVTVGGEIKTLNDLIEKTKPSTETVTAAATVDVNFSLATSSVGSFVINGTSPIAAFTTDTEVTNATVVGELYAGSIYSGKDNFAQNIYIANSLSSASLSVSTGSQNDTINNYANNVTISGGAGNDSIVNYGSNALIVTGDGDDEVNLNVSVVSSGSETTNTFAGSNVTIDAGAGNDRISLDSVGSLRTIYYTKGDGNDTIWGCKDGDKVTIANGNYESTRSGDDVIITVGEEKISLVGAADKMLDIVGVTAVQVNLNVPTVSGSFVIDGTSSVASFKANSAVDSIKETIVGSVTGSSIYSAATNSIASNIAQYIHVDAISKVNDKCIVSATANNDSIAATESQITLNSGNGDDFIMLTNSHTYSSINAGDGDDYIVNSGGSAISIEGGNGDDYIGNFSASCVSINGGKGNDKISLANVSEGSIVSASKASYIYYTEGDGNDTISHYNDDSRIYISSLHQACSVKSGNDLIIGVGNESITLLDAADITPVLIDGNTGEEITLRSANDVTEPMVSVNLNSTTTITSSSVDTSVFAVSPSSSVASFKANSAVDSSKESIVGSVTSNYVYVAENNSVSSSSSIASYAQKISVGSKNWNVTATSNDDVINVAGNNSTIASGAGNDKISVGSSVSEITFADFDVANDNLEFARDLANYSFNIISNDDSQVVLTSKVLNMTFKNISMTEDFLDYNVTVGGESKTIRQLLAINRPVEDRIMHSSRESRWNYTFSVQVDSDTESSADLASSADLIDDGEFAYFYGNGNSTIDHAGNGDTINLYGITLEQITGAEISSGAVNINFNDGGKLTVLGQNNNTYSVGGDTWKANQEIQTWQQIS